MTYAYKAVRMTPRQRDILAQIARHGRAHYGADRTANSLAGKGLIELRHSPGKTWQRWHLTTSGEREAQRLGYSTGQEG